MKVTLELQRTWKEECKSINAAKLRLVYLLDRYGDTIKGAIARVEYDDVEKDQTVAEQTDILSG